MYWYTFQTVFLVEKGAEKEGDNMKKKWMCSPHL